MPTRVAVDDDEQQIQDLIKEMRRLRSRLATTGVKGTHDEFTAAATPATTYTLTYIPLTGTCLMALNGHVQREGTDYTCDYDTGIVTVSATQASADKLTFRYLVTDWLVARSLPAATGASASYVNGAFRTSSAGSPLTLPTWTVGASDYIFLEVAADDAAATLTTPTGYTLLLGPTVAATGVGPKMWVFGKTAVSGDSAATVTLTLGGTFASWSALARVYSSYNHIAASGIQGNGSTAVTTHPTPNLSFTDTGVVEVGFYAVVTTNGSLALLAPSTWTAHHLSQSNITSPFVPSQSADFVVSGTTDETTPATSTIAATSVTAKLALAP